MSEFSLRDIFCTQDGPVHLQYLKSHIELLIATKRLSLSELYICKIRLVKASHGFEHETVIVTVQCTASQSYWELAFNRSQCGSPDHTLDPLPFDYPPGPRGNTFQAADSSLESLKITGHPAKDIVTLLDPSSLVVKQDAIVQVLFTIPTPSSSGSQAFILEPSPNHNDLKGHSKPLFFISFINLAELLHQEGNKYNLFLTNCFWISGTLLRACAAYFGIPSDHQEQIGDQGSDHRTPGSYKQMAITDLLLEEKMETVISKWKMANQKFMSSDAVKTTMEIEELRVNNEELRARSVEIEELRTRLSSYVSRYG